MRLRIKILVAERWSKSSIFPGTTAAKQWQNITTLNSIVTLTETDKNNTQRQKLTVSTHREPYSRCFHSDTRLPCLEAILLSSSSFSLYSFKWSLVLKLSLKKLKSDTKHIWSASNNVLTVLYLENCKASSF